jgi:hypothetical protein
MPFFNRSISSFLNVRVAKDDFSNRSVSPLQRPSRRSLRYIGSRNVCPRKRTIHRASVIRSAATLAVPRPPITSGWGVAANFTRT